MKRKTRRHCKRPQFLHGGVPYPTGHKSIDSLSLYDKDLHHEIIKTIWNSAIFKVVFQMLSNGSQVLPDHDLIYFLNLLKNVCVFTFSGTAFHSFGLKYHEAFASVELY